MYKNLGPKAIKVFTAIYKASYSLGYVPKAWRNSKVAFIPKPGKEDYAELGSFRPISLMSFGFKAAERILNWHLKEKCDTACPLSRFQHAYSRTRGM